MIYFDYAATTKMDEQVLETYEKVAKKHYYHLDNTKESLKIKNAAIKKIISILNLEGYELIFTPSGTLANHMLVTSIADKFSSKKHFITSKYEHNSMLKTFQYLETLGHQVTYINPNTDGIINSEDVIKEIKKNTVLVSIMTVNNELGTVNDIDEISKNIKNINPQIVVITDFIQGLGKIKIPTFKYIDAFTISGHKISGPKGIGIVFYQKKLNFTNTNAYEHYNTMLRGTQPLENIIAITKAIELLMDNYNDKLINLNDNLNYLTQKLKVIQGVEFNTLPITNIVSITFNNILQGESLEQLFYDNGFKISTKSACSTKVKSTSISLKAIGVKQEIMQKTIRISISNTTTKTEIDQLCNFIKKVSTNNESNFN